MRLPLSLINLANWKYPFSGRDPFETYYSTAVRSDEAVASAETDDMNTGLGYQALGYQALLSIWVTKPYSISSAGLVSFNALLRCRQSIISSAGLESYKAFLRCRLGYHA